MKRAILAAGIGLLALHVAGAMAQTRQMPTGQPMPMQTTPMQGGQMHAGPVGRAGGASAERGRYVAMIGGCNDCHTAEYGPVEGRVAQSDWLRGTSVGFRGPWGTTYPINLRLYMSRYTEDQWVANARVLKTRPPMPWFNVQAMTETDLRALYRFIRTLPGELGGKEPAFVPPNETPKTPFIVFVPQNPG